MTKIYSIIYKTGGTDNAKWHRVLSTFTKEEAQAKLEEIRRMGYDSVSHETKLLDSIGLPD